MNQINYSNICNQSKKFLLSFSGDSGALVKRTNDVASQYYPEELNGCHSPHLSFTINPPPDTTRTRTSSVASSSATPAPISRSESDNRLNPADATAALQDPSLSQGCDVEAVADLDEGQVQGPRIVIDALTDPEELDAGEVDVTAEGGLDEERAEVSDDSIMTLDSLIEDGAEVAEDDFTEEEGFRDVAEGFGEPSTDEEDVTIEKARYEDGAMAVRDVQVAESLPEDDVRSTSRTQDELIATQEASSQHSDLLTLCEGQQSTGISFELSLTSSDTFERRENITTSQWMPFVSRGDFNAPNRANIVAETEEEVDRVKRQLREDAENVEETLSKSPPSPEVRSTDSSESETSC